MDKFVSIELRQIEKYRNNIAALQWAIDHAPAAYTSCLIDTKHIILKLCGAAEEQGAPAVQTGNSIKPKMPSFAYFTKGIHFLTVGEGSKAFEVYTRLARHFGR